MRLSDIILYAEAALEQFGDLDCYMEIEDEDIYETMELVCERDEVGDRILITNYKMPKTELRLVK